MASTVWVAVLLTVLLGASVAEVCEDADTAACILFLKAQSTFCQDYTTASKLCKRHCKLCPLQCYDCINPVTDPAQCQQNSTCSSGNACGLREVRSSDGRHEFTMGCISNTVCDGGDPQVAIGRRAAEKRDFSIRCCYNDFCNDGGVAKTTTSTFPPTAPPTTSIHPTCHKHIQFLVESSALKHHFNLTAVKLFLTSFVTKLDIGPGKTLVGIAAYDDDLHSEISLSHGQTTHDVIDAIHDLHTHHDFPDIFEVLQDLDQLWTNRFAAYPNVIVILSNGVDRHHHDSYVARQLYDLQRKGVKVISMEIGGQLTNVDPYADHVVHLAGFDTASFSGATSDLLTAICS